MQLQVSHWQVALHVCEPSTPQACDVAEMQTPSPEHADHAVHVPLLQLRDWVPQLPHAWDKGPGHVRQVPHWQVVASHVCVPFVPQAWVAFLEQTPSFEQADQVDQVPLLHVRV
jgi:hypothetical protein